MRKLVIVVLLCVVTGGGAAIAGAAEAATVITHRGASRVAPENTLAAITAALRSGADIIEVDVRLTQDRQPVLLHDATLARTTNAERRYPGRAPWRVGDFTLAELARLDAGGWKDAAYRGERIPTLADALDAVRGRAGLLIELKGPRRDLSMERLVAQHLTTDGTATGPVDPGQVVMVQSFDYLAVARFAALQPDVETGVLVRGAPSPAQLMIFSQFADQVVPPHRHVTADMVAAARRHDLQIAAYTVNGARRMRQLLGLGVDGVVTNVPARLRRVRDAAAR